jgi:hypothetical protein
MGLQRRVEALEAARWRRAATDAAPPGFTADDVLDQCIRFLEMPLEQQRCDYPHYTDDERREMSTWLPAIRRARSVHH